MLNPWDKTSATVEVFFGRLEDDRPQADLCVGLAIANYFRQNAQWQNAQKIPKKNFFFVQFTTCILLCFVV